MMETPSPQNGSGDPAANEHSKVTADVIKAAMALAQRDVDLGLITVEQAPRSASLSRPRC
jgi:hypothetical protein